uniref:Uncharacterized protein n=1 Tax=Schizaphis graminum TaxID=13262 RepID=A0A2S2NUL1_SCHGA
MHTLYILPFHLSANDKSWYSSRIFLFHFHTSSNFRLCRDSYTPFQKRIISQPTGFRPCPRSRPYPSADLGGRIRSTCAKNDYSPLGWSVVKRRKFFFFTLLYTVLSDSLG